MAAEQLHMEHGHTILLCRPMIVVTVKRVIMGVCGLYTCVCKQMSGHMTKLTCYVNGKW